MDNSKLYRLARAAQLCQVGRTTLLAAIDRGEIKPHPTACGLPLVTLPAVRRWARQERKPGRKPKGSK